MNVNEIRLYVRGMLPRIAVYFATTLGFNIELFEEQMRDMNLAEQLLFVKLQEKKKHFI